MTGSKWSGTGGTFSAIWSANRAFRLTVFAAVTGLCAGLYLFGGASKTVLVIIVLCAPVFVLIVPELFGFWEWLIGRAEAHAVDREERIYRFGYTDIRMLMASGNPWFAAADVCGALGLADVKREIKHFEASKCRDLGSGEEPYLSEAAVKVLAERSRHPDARSFRNWFTREVMTPFARARDSREPAGNRDKIQ